MDQKEKRFVEQDAPLKNTDRAFVKVSRENSPQPSETSGEKRKATNAEEESREKTNDQSAAIAPRKK